MIARQLGTGWGDVWLIAVSTVGIYVAVIVYTRLAGLRSFSKMSSFDFAMTIAVGSIMASVAVSSPSLLEGLVGLGTLFVVQVGVAALRRWTLAARLVDNRPLLLMQGRDMLYDNLRAARITEDDVRSKLREANVLRDEDIRAVVLETTGDISVLHGPELEPGLLDGVRRQP
ncbi:MAG TPA: YetF domain-containing protein [Nitriliruptorales bacterium]|nr:YetF domain-containing protein [Nitriliruptorales bacterium]